MIPVLAGLAAVLSAAGVAQALLAAQRVGTFASGGSEAPVPAPPVTVLKPLHGDEPLLEPALRTFFEQDYSRFQLVFGLQHEADPAAAIVRDLQRRFPNIDSTLVVDPTLRGANRKVGNLINMLPSARFDVLVIADSDIHVRPDYLTRLAAALGQPGVGLVTTLYAGLPVPTPGGSVPLVSRLGATQITHGFLPSAVLARALGRQDCLGATMCLQRADLQRIGGFAALVDHLADDNVLGRRIAGLGLTVALARTVPLTTVPETRLSALWRHELRWARTIRALEPAGFAASVLQYPLAWALLAILLAGGAIWSVGSFFFAWVLRAAAAITVDRALAPFWHDKEADDRGILAFSCPVWLLPLRDILSVAVMLASYAGRRVDWRGHALLTDTPPPDARHTETYRPIEGTSTR